MSNIYIYIYIYIYVLRQLRVKSKTTAMIGRYKLIECVVGNFCRRQYAET